jgi:hypothetical protein
VISLQDLNVLSTASQEVMVEFANEDALTMWKTYGTISNPTAKVDLDNQNL